MNKKERLLEFIHGELDHIYCYNCKHQENCENDDCHRKYMGWQVSDGVIDEILKIAMRKEE